MVQPPLGRELGRDEGYPEALSGRRLETQNLKYLRVTAMAERHRFRVLVIDLETGTVAFAGEGK